MLSINVFDIGLDGWSIYGAKKLEINVLNNLLAGVKESTFKRSILRSPNREQPLFSLEIYKSRGSIYSSINWTIVSELEGCW